MMRLYMSSSTFKTGEFAILVTIISKGCNGYGAVCGYYKFCFLRDFPTVTVFTVEDFPYHLRSLPAEITRD